MGVDRHELEHRNWRSSTSGKAPARDTSSEDSELSIVPDDVIAANVDLPSNAKTTRPRGKRAKAD